MLERLLTEKYTPHILTQILKNLDFVELIELQQAAKFSNSRLLVIFIKEFIMRNTIDVFKIFGNNNEKCKLRSKIIIKSDDEDGEKCMREMTEVEAENDLIPLSEYANFNFYEIIDDTNSR